MTSRRVILVGAILWALAFILSAAVLRGRVVGDWIEGILLVGWIVFSSLWYARASRNKA